MIDDTRNRIGNARSAEECLSELQQTIEGIAKVPRQPRALRLMLEHAQSQVDELRFAIERDLPSVPDVFASDR
jgi:hypothetical protein